jgi:Ni/Fe-hydrogenase subunit HybB-like protein
MDSLLIDRLFSDYYSLFIFANYIGILIPCIIIAFPKFRTIPNITIAAVIAVTALWVNRYIIVIPTLETPFLPIQDARPDWIKYSPTWVEWSLTFAGISVYGMLFMLVSKIAPIISISEMKETDQVEIMK